MRPKIALSVPASSRTRSVCVITVAILVPTSLASASASVPTTTYSFLTNPSSIEPEEILYHPSTSSKTCPADLSYNFPAISSSSLGPVLTLT